MRNLWVTLGCWALAAVVAQPLWWMMEATWRERAGDIACMFWLIAAFQHLLRDWGLYPAGRAATP